MVGVHPTSPLHEVVEGGLLPERRGHVRAVAHKLGGFRVDAAAHDALLAIHPDRLPHRGAVCTSAPFARGAERSRW